MSTELAMNAAAMGAVMFNGVDIISHLEEGCADRLYLSISEWSATVTEEQRLLSDVLAEANEDWPGVFIYEVTEEVGAFLRGVIVAGRNESIDTHMVQKVTRFFAIKFLREGGCPHSVLSEYVKRSREATV